MLTILGRKSSANVQKVHWICHEGNVQFQAVNIGGKFKGHETDEFKKINPNSTIPVLKDDDFYIYESNAIIKYISVKFDIIQNNDSQLEALNNQWLDWSSLVFGLPCAIYTAHTLLLPRDKRNNVMAKEAKDKIYSIFKILNTQLSKNSFILENKINLADISIGCWLNRCKVLEIDFSSYNSLSNWFLKLSERQAFKKAVETAPMPPN